MKKTLLAALAALLILPAFAQKKSNAPVIFANEEQTVSVYMINHVGVGYHILQDPDFKPLWPGEWFLNFVNLRIRPVEALQIDLGIDMKFNHFTSKESLFTQNNDRLVRVAPFSSLLEGSYTRTRGGLDVLSFTAPVLVKGCFGDFRVGLGVEGSINLDGNTYMRYSQDRRNISVSEEQARVNRFTFAPMAMAAYGEVGVYFKYYPKSSQLLPAGSANLGQVLTIGVIQDM